MKPIVTLDLRTEQDVVFCRQRVRQAAELLRFDRQDQTRIATAFAEITRNALEYASGGKVTLALADKPFPMFLIAVKDSGPGIPNLDAILSGQYVSATGLGLGILGARRLTEHFEIESQVGVGTQVIVGKALSEKAPAISAHLVHQLAGELAHAVTQDPLREVQRQNQELLRTLDELREHQAELAKLNRELEETNRGVVALYAELDEKAESLKRASATKTAFLSNMTHEFRTPLNSILSLTRATLSEQDAPLDPEHRKQVTFVLKSAENLSEMVNDLLDIAKVEAGRIDVRPSYFAVTDRFGGLRGVLKPLSNSNPAVALVFEEPNEPIALATDEGKIAQVLRNLVSNALKYTERGEVRVTAQLFDDGWVEFVVRDTGIGIPYAEQERIFEEFIQVENPLQSKSKGTGLGLPLSRKLAQLMGGHLVVESEPGVGSVFRVQIPAQFGEVLPRPGLKREAPRQAPASRPLVFLAIDDEEVARYLLRRVFSDDRVRLIEASDGFEGVRIAAEMRPDVIFLDLQMPAMSGFYVLELLKSNPLTRDIPVIIHTAMTLTRDESQLFTTQALGVLAKDLSSPEMTRARIEEILGKVGIRIARAPKEEVRHG